MVGSKPFHHSGTEVNRSAFKITSSPTLKNASVAIEAEGWGRLRNFSVNVTDNAGDTVTVIAWEKIGTEFVQIGNQTCTSCSDTVLTFTSSYICTASNLGSGKTFKFNATDTEGNSGETTIAAKDYNSDDLFEIEKDDVNLTLISGNNSNATLLSAAVLKLRIFDIDNNTFNLTETATVTFNITKQGTGSNFSTEGTAVTNGEGFANFSFIPDRSFIRDVQDWKGFIDTQTCYRFNESGIFNVTTFTNVPQLSNESVTPKSGGWGIERFFNVTVNDTHNNATIFLFESTEVDGTYTPLGHENITYSHAEDVNRTIHDASTAADSSFNYTEEINFTAFNFSLFNVTIRNLDLFNISFNLTVNNFSVAVNQSVVNGTNVSVGVLLNATLNLPGNNTINITIMNSSSGKVIDAKYTADLNYRMTGVVRTLIFSVNLTRDHDVGTTDLGKTFFFKFNSSNTVGNENETELLTVNNFTVTKDTLIFENLTGNSSIANRTSNQIDLLLIRVFDQDNGTYVGNLNVTFSVTTDGSAFDSGFKNLTNITGFARSEFDPTCVSPKYEVGNQSWKIVIADEDKYFDISLLKLNLTMQGDIGLDFSKPDGTRNFTQEDTVDFSGATVDDCGAALVTTVIYHANTSGSGFLCGDTSQLGANVFTCENVTTLSTAKGFYNTTMFANATFHYDNSTQNNISADSNSGLFFLFPKKKLDTPIGSPLTGGWGRPDWNFTVIASSGDPGAPINITLFMEKGVPNPTTECNSPTCANQTTTLCTNCIDQTIYWNRTFTNDDIGDWFFQFKMNDTDSTATSGTANTVTVGKDATNITYGGQGNNSNVFKTSPSRPVNLSVIVFDTERNTSNLIPNATVTFKLRHSSYTNDDSSKTIGSAKTSDIFGNATFFFNITDSDCPPNIFEGAQNWTAEINSTEANYNQSISKNFSVITDTTGCEATLQIVDILEPKETFQYRQFVINTTIKALSAGANNVNVTIIAPSEWVILNRSQGLGIIAENVIKPVSWTINATTFGEFNITINATSSNAANVTKISRFFTVYKEFPSLSVFEPTLPVLVNASKNLTAYWSCAVGEYRAATLNISYNTSDTTGTTIRVLTYDGSKFVDVLHSFFVKTDKRIDSKLVPILENQLNANETGFCAIKIRNIGLNNLNITDLFLQSYFNETIVVQDILFDINGFNTTGIEPTEKHLNISVKVTNSINLTFNITIVLNITNSTGGSKNSSTHLNITLAANSTITENFLHINTSTWNPDDYTITAFVEGNITGTPTRSETFIFKYVNLTASSVKYICNEATETFDVTIVHPFTDPIDYNVSLTLPGGWTYSGHQIITAESATSYTATFNITSGPAAAENITINATLNFTYPRNISKQIQAVHSIEERNDIPILKVVRETPKITKSDGVFESQISIDNKGCAATSVNTIIKETLSTGWTPANPDIKTNSDGTDITLVSSTTNLETNVITWELGTIPVDRYAILTYQIKSPTSAATPGELKFNATWDEDRTDVEPSVFKIQTFNFTSESHLEFDLDAIQQAAFPQPEPRSTQLNKTYNYSLKVTNIGDIAAENWNITLTIPQSCNATEVFNGGNFNSTSRKITWGLPSLAVRAVTERNFTFNCTSVGEFILVAQGIKDNTSYVSISNSTNIGCSGSRCTSVESFSFTKPSDARYEKLSQINFSIYYNWTGTNVTIGQGLVNITDDLGAAKLVWQEYSFTDTSRNLLSNYSIDLSDQAQFVKTTRSIGVRNYVDATSAPIGNVTVRHLNYTWSLGKVFEEPQNLFIKVKVYTYTPLFKDPVLIINGNNTVTVGGWGEYFNFTVNVSERFGRNITVIAWHKKGVAAYTPIANFTCESCTDFTLINFTFNYNGSDITSVGGWTFKFGRFFSYII